MELQTIWSWQPALYLFLGGMGAGAFVMAAVLFLIDRTRHRLIVCVSMWAALASLAVGLLLLLSELVTPLRGLMMWQSFGHFTSWMTYGAWGAFAAMAVFAVSALLATRPVGVWLAKKWKWFEKRGVALRRVLAVIGIVLGAFVAVYTGMLLMAAGSVPLWSTPLLPALFTVSAFDTGVALVELVALALSKKDALAPKARVLMERIVVVLVLVEMKKLPGALFVVDPRKERNAINEARKLHIPIVAIVDTNCDPDEIDYVIPGNDDAIRAIKLISGVMANAIQEGKQGQDASEASAEKEAAAE